MSGWIYSASSFDHQLLALLLSPERTRLSLPLVSVRAGQNWAWGGFALASLLGRQTLGLAFDRVTGLREGRKGEKMCVFQMLPWSSLWRCLCVCQSR